MTMYTVCLMLTKLYKRSAGIVVIFASLCSAFCHINHIPRLTKTILVTIKEKGLRSKRVAIRGLASLASPDVTQIKVQIAS